LTHNLPLTYEEFARLLDDYEREHFGRDEGAHAVASATLALLATIPPNDRLPERLVRLASLSLLDAPLLDALGLPHPPGSGARTGAGRAPAPRACAALVPAEARAEVCPAGAGHPALPAWARRQSARDVPGPADGRPGLSSARLLVGR